MHLGLGTALVPGLLAALLACAPAATAQEDEDDSRCGRYDSLNGPAGTSPPWHVARACLRELRKGGTTDPASGRSDRPGEVRDFVLKVFAAPDVRFYDGTHSQGLPFSAVLTPDGTVRRDFARVAQVSGAGQPYNGMGHTGLGVMLYGLADRAQRQGGAQADDARLYRKLARAAFSTALLPTRENGLAESAPCDRQQQFTCTWFYSVTSRSTPTGSGATLNQHLHMVRDFGSAADVVRKNGWENGDDYEQAFRAGLNQLFLSAGHTRAGQPPNLRDFIPSDTGRTMNGAWAFYGFNPMREPPAGGYYLNRGGKDCHYHFHDLQLIDQILKRASRNSQIAPLDASLRSCASALHDLYASARRQAEGPSPSKPPEDGRDRSCKALPKNAQAWLSGTEAGKLYDGCDRR